VPVGFAYFVGGSLAVMGMTLFILIPEPLVKLLVVIPHLMLAWFFVHRFAGTGAYFNTDGLRIQRIFSTEFVPWRDVRRFSLQPRGARTMTCHVETEGGRLIWIEGIGPERREQFSPEVEAIILHMNRLLPRYKQD
jgi:hypothetical protein